MNWNSPLLTAAVFAAATLLASCEGMSGVDTSGPTINNPSVDEMARLEAQWGMKPREVKPRYREAGPADYLAPSAPIVQPQPADVATPAPAVPPQETVQPAIPPAPPAIPPSLR
jgi:hypothetical protein